MKSPLSTPMTTLLAMVLVSVSLSIYAKNTQYPELALGADTIFDDDVTYRILSFQIPGVPSTRFRGVGGDDSFPTASVLFNDGWYYRVEGDAQEFALGEPTLSDFSGDTAILEWIDVDGRGLFDIQRVITVTEVVPGQGTLDNILMVTNISDRDLIITLFHYTDIDAAGFGAGDTGSLVSLPDYIRVVDGTNTVEYRAGDNDFYMAGQFLPPDMQLGLLDDDIDNFDNTGLPFTAGDIAAGFQWLDITIPVRGTLSLGVTVGSDTPAPEPLPLTIFVDDVLFFDGFE